MSTARITRLEKGDLQLINCTLKCMQIKESDPDNLLNLPKAL